MKEGPEITLKYQNQYFCFGVHLNSRLSQLICELPIDLVVVRADLPLYIPWSVNFSTDRLTSLMVGLALICITNAKLNTLPISLSLSRDLVPGNNVKIPFYHFISTMRTGNVNT